MDTRKPANIVAVISRRRFTYVVFFLITWVIAIVARLIQLSVFGPDAATRYSPIIIIYIAEIAVLLASSILPPNLADLTRSAGNPPGRVGSVDKLYLRMVRNRTTLIIICLGIFIVTLVLHRDAAHSHQPYIWLATALCTTSVIRFFLL